MLLRDSLLLLHLKYPGDVVEAQRVGGIPSTSVTYIYIYILCKYSIPLVRDHILSY